MAAALDPSGLTALCIFMMIVSTLAVILRVWSRLTQKEQNFWWDDWCAIASLPLVLIFLSVLLLLISTNLGHHENQTASNRLLLSLKYGYVHELLYQPAITMPKYSALLFYVRVFGVGADSRFFRMNIVAAACVVTVWLFWALLFDIFQCSPVRKIWLPTTPGHCIRASSNWFVAFAAVNTVIDVYIMLLPLPILWSMHTGRKRKIVLTGFFFCAYCVITCSLGRLVTSVQLDRKLDGDLTWSITRMTTFLSWTAAELSISIVSICIPNMTQLFRRTHQHGFSALFTRREFVAGPENRSKNGPPGSAWVQGSNNGFPSNTGKYDVSFALNGDAMSSTEDSGLYSMSASTQQSEQGSIVAFGQTHLRNNSDVREYGSWATV